MSMGKRIFELRTKLRLSREDAVERIENVSSRTLEKYEGDVTAPPADTLKRIAKAYGTTVAYIVEETNDPSPEALSPVTNYQLSMGDTELADPKLMELMEEELAAIRRLRIEREKQIQSNLRSGKDRTKGD